MIIVLNWLILIMTFGLVEVADVEYYDNDTPIVELHNYSLNDIFYNGNLINNIDFSNNASGWNLPNGSYSISDNVFSFTANAKYDRVRQTHNNSFSNNDAIYISLDVLAPLNYPNLIVGGTYSSNSETTYSGSGDWERLSNIHNYGGTGSYEYRFMDKNNTGYSYQEVSCKNPYLINLHDFNIHNLAVNDLDYYRDIYESNIVYDYDFTLNTLDMTHITIIVGSFFLWTWLYKFLKGVVL